MNTGKEFEKYAVKHRGISSNTLDAYIKHNVTNLTPNIIEERPMNVAVMDVYSRLMMDRIIFLGYPVNDKWPISSLHNCFFWKALIEPGMFSYTLIHPAAEFMPASDYTIPCSLFRLILQQFVQAWPQVWQRY